MKSTVLASLAVAALVFSGCSQKNPEVDMTEKKSEMTKTEMADSKMDNVSGMDTNKMDSMKSTADMVAEMIAKLEANSGAVYFDFDKYDIRADMQPVVSSNADLFNSADAANLSIKVEGNCDEWGTDEYNYALGLKRAKSVKDALAAQGVSSDRVMVVSYGESNPTCKESNKACWDKNRRAEFKLLP